ncbi:peptidoglycan bridge formation glycyltransferase FemA/FemB family protein [bacterium]|nr:MAG: peptidoglycan bridge formation glycyltransferase FemA/FemB family protein [bacterium]
MMREVTAEELDKFLIENNGPFLQSSKWAGFQNGFGRPAWFLRLGRGMGSAVKFELPFGKNYLYLPKGPVGVEHWGDAIDSLRELALEQKSIFFRVDPEIRAREIDLAKFGLARSPKETQARQTVIVDLEKSETEMLAQMHPKTRYNIKLGEKKELGIVNYELGTGFEPVWQLFQKTAKRDKFHLHEREYYEKMLKLDGVKLFAAHFEGKPIAAAIVSMFAGKAVYLHGASDYEHRQLMAPYLLHWNIMKFMKAQGCRHYDFGGVAPKDEPNHPWVGISRFKLGFGGEYVEYVGSWDFVMDKMWYGIYKIARRIV